MATAAAIASLLGAACGHVGSADELEPRLCLRESPTIPFAVGDTATLQVGPLDANDSSCAVNATSTTWHTSNRRVIALTERGFARAVAPGRALITVVGRDSEGESAADSATFVVVPALRDVRIVPDSVTLSLGDSAVFRIVTTGGGSSVPVWWYSGDAALSFARPGSKVVPASATASTVTVWAAQPGTALLEAGTRYLRDAAHVRVVVR